MELTTKQIEGIKIAKERYNNKEKYTVISGFAGTGKSTLVSYLIEELINDDPYLDEEDIVYTAFTGKACTVLQQKGNKNVTTLHKLLYKTIPTRDGKFMRTKKDEIDYSIVVCDECSMVPVEMAQILLSHNVYIIFCGDPFQLPPVDKDSNNHLLDSPHVFLDQVMRQALDSDIIRLSMLIRNGEPFSNFKGQDAQVISKAELNTGMLTWADIVLCATNATRISMNQQIRQLKGFEGEYQNGEKVICLKNNWDAISDTENALVNGTIGYLYDPFCHSWHYPNYCKVPDNCIGVLTGKFISETGDDFGSLDMDKQMLVKGNSKLDNKMRYVISRSKNARHLLPEEFAYGYAITCHKSQGSQWDKVLVMEEKFPFEKEEHARWLYTAVTRASSRCVLVR